MTGQFRGLSAYIGLTYIDLINAVDKNDHEFWKTIGKVGVSQARDKRFPMEVVLEDGSIDTENRGPN